MSGPLPRRAEPLDEVTAGEGAALAGLAVAAVATRLARTGPLPGVTAGRAVPAALDAAVLASAALRAPGATFVTLTRRGRLRGCIGSLEPARPRYRDVIRNAVRAAADPRLPPVTAADWPELDVSVAVLSATEPIPCTTREELLAALRPGEDGLVLSQGRRRATFLPKVWQKLSTPEQFVTGLLVKGGWRADQWPAGIRASRYRVREFDDQAPR
ncbi:MAG TPA: AmmeMemoRadiSam system protein A [Natronosporangium sp.]